MQKSINGASFRKMILASAKVLDDNKKFVDELNVFPVPDGDTGTNMSLTLKMAMNEVATCPSNNLDMVCDAYSKGALKGARGNSGVITSQIIKGMCNVFKQETEINVKNFASALKEGAEVAYKAVTKPKEGTILTVIRVMADSAQTFAKKTSDLEEFLQNVLDAGEDILAQTPEMLPVLKKAGVVDAGGRGLLIIFNGYLKALKGDEDLTLDVESFNTTEYKDSNEAIINLDDLGDIKFAYCTELFVLNMNKKTTESDIDKLREYLMTIGDCVVCVGDLNLVKIHVHTNEPNKALTAALELGEINNVKVENMLEQNRELKRKRNQGNVSTKPFGIVCVAAGDGLEAVFKDLGVDYVIKGGQTMNPSANDIAEAVEKVPATDVFVFPNNKNIILAAEQAKSLSSRNIHVIPTTSVPEGVSALLAFNADGSVEDNVEAMTTSAGTVKSGSVTFAVRKTNINGFELNENDIIGLDSKDIVAKSSVVSDAVEQTIEKLVSDDTCNITLFYGEGVNEEEAVELQDKIQKKYDFADVNVVYGGQPVYYYLLSVE